MREHDVESRNIYGCSYVRSTWLIGVGRSGMHIPNARRERLIIEELEGETLVYDLDSHKAHSLNASAALVWRHCDGRTTVSDIARIMHNELKAPLSEDLVLLALDRLQTARL